MPGECAAQQWLAVVLGIDGAVCRIAPAYEVRGLRKTLTSYDNPTVDAGSVVNEVETACSGFSQLVSKYQEHSGTVNTSSTPKVKYAYADGSKNHVRPMSATCPAGSAITHNDGSASGTDDAAGRL